MKVLQINSFCGYGSTGKIATDIYKVLEEQGHECLIAYGRGIAPKEINSIKIGTNFDNYMHVAKTRLFDKHGFASTKATKEFIKKAKEYDPDVIHLHNIHGYYINIELLFNYLKEANKPVVWTLHDCWTFTGHCAYFDYVGCDKWKTGCYSCPEKNAYPSSLILDNSKNNYVRKKDVFSSINELTIVTPSRWLADLVQKSYLKEYPVKVINNGIDLNTFRPIKGDFRKKYNVGDKFVILGVASVWDRRKGLEYFIELADNLSEDEVIVLVGLTEKQIEQIPKSIIGITRTNNIEELVDIYSSADVFVNPTLEEVMGMTNVEAIACGTPVITFNSGGSPECIDGSTGILVGKGDIKQLRNEIFNIKDNLFSEFNLIERARKFYNKNDRYQEYLNVYSRLSQKWVR